MSNTSGKVPGERPRSPVGAQSDTFGTRVLRELLRVRRQDGAAIATDGTEQQPRKQAA